jgi:hypothetical protein
VIRENGEWPNAEKDCRSQNHSPEVFRITTSVANAAIVPAGTPDGSVDVFVLQALLRYSDNGASSE